MKKLRLDLDDLRVESFATPAVEAAAPPTFSRTWICC